MYHLRADPNVLTTTQNNGQITQAIDAVSGETVAYAYDSLNRVITAATTGPQWGLSFGYDGFGNRLSQTVTKGSGPASSLAISLANNRITTSGYSYDSNGNLTTMPYGAGSMTLTYDVENRVIQAVNSNGTEQYGYSPDNRRVYQKQPSGTQWIRFYGANGDRLRTYTYYGNGIFSVLKTNLYFAGRVILQNGQAAFVDRIGSDRRNTRYYPYGEEYTATTNDKDKFATYFRDSNTGLDYAMNRYYGSNIGRFLTPDPFGESAKPDKPQSWNRYPYVLGDPVNSTDPSGLDLMLVDDQGRPLVGGGGSITVSGYFHNPMLELFLQRAWYASLEARRLLGIAGETPESHGGGGGGGGGTSPPEVKTPNPCDRIKTALKGVLNLGIGQAKLAGALGTASATPVGGPLSALGTGYLGVSAMGNFAAATFQLAGAISGDLDKIGEVGNAATTVTSITGLATLLVTGNLQTANTWATGETFSASGFMGGWSGNMIDQSVNLIQRTFLASELLQGVAELAGVNFKCP